MRLTSPLASIPVPCPLLVLLPLLLPLLLAVQTPPTTATEILFFSDKVSHWLINKFSKYNIIEEKKEREREIFVSLPACYTESRKENIFIMLNI
jgi:hypothetical protein